MTNEIEKELKRKVWAKFETKEKETDEIVEDWFFLNSLLSFIVKIVENEFIF